MALVFPFRAVRYAESEAGDLSRLTAPPYDVISAEDQKYYYGLDPHNVIRLILGEQLPGDDSAENRYIRAKRFLERWLSEGVLAEEKEPCMYVYGQEYRGSMGETRRQRGIVALLRLAEFGRGVLPHEHTLSGPKADRLELLRATRCHFSPLLVLYGNPAEKLGPVLDSVTAGRTLGAVQDKQGVTHRLWVVRETGTISWIAAKLKPCDVYIADGHHRYETALAFRREVQEERGVSDDSDPTNHVMVCLFDMDEGPPSILAAHRLIKSAKGMNGEKLRKRLSPYFEIEDMPFSGNSPCCGQTLFNRMREGRERHSFGLYEGGTRCQLLSLKEDKLPEAVAREEKLAGDRHLDVTVMHRLILDELLNGGAEMPDENLAYMTDERKASAAVADGRYDLVFFLNPTPMEVVRQVALAGKRMPGKATYFHPKLLSGLLINRMRPGEPILLPSV